jgi:hypothetical protein
MSEHDALSAFISGRHLLPAGKTVGEVYEEYKEEDGFLYVIYQEQESFGSPTPPWYV